MISALLSLLLALPEKVEQSDLSKFALCVKTSVTSKTFLPDQIYVSEIELLSEIKKSCRDLRSLVRDKLIAKAAVASNTRLPENLSEARKEEMMDAATIGWVNKVLIDESLKDEDNAKD